MNITEVRIKLCEQNSERLMAFCSVTFDHCFVVRDLKIIEGTKGLFVAMPSRKLTDRCQCGCKNHLRAKFCNQCGSRLDDSRGVRESLDGRAKLHADIAHPIHAGAREMVQTSVIRAFHEEKERAKMPNYVCRYDDFDAGDFDETPLSYATMVQETAGKMTKSHSGHPSTNRTTHLEPAGATKTRVREEFAAGIE